MSREKTTEASLPLHRRIALNIQEEIARKGLPPHAKLPSEVALARQYGVSHGTMTKALETLVHEGIVYRRRPQGTFVAAPSTAEQAATEERADDLAEQVRAQLISPLPSTQHETVYSGVHTPASSATTPAFIGLLVPHYADSFLNRAVLGIETMTRAAGYGLSFAYFEEDGDLERYHIQQFLRQGVAGIIMFPADFVVRQTQDGQLISVDGAERIHMLQMLQQQNIPFVLLDRYIPEVECSYVVSDDFSAGYAATHHLISAGHKRIAFLNITQQVTSCLHRYNGYRKCLQDYHLPFDESLLLETLWQKKKAWRNTATSSFYELGSEDLEQVCAFLNSPQRPTAIVAMNDYVALLVLKAAEQVNLAIPEELALVCGGGTDFGNHTRVPLTMVIQPTAEMGRMGAQILLDQIAHRISGIRQMSLPVSLVLRRSSGAEDSKVALLPPSQDELQMQFNK